MISTKNPRARNLHKNFFEFILSDQPGMFSNMLHSCIFAKLHVNKLIANQHVYKFIAPRSANEQLTATHMMRIL